MHKALWFSSGIFCGLLTATGILFILWYDGTPLGVGGEDKHYMMWLDYFEKRSVDDFRQMRKDKHGLIVNIHRDSDPLNPSALFAISGSLPEDGAREPFSEISVYCCGDQERFDAMADAVRDAVGKNLRWYREQTKKRQPLNRAEIRLFLDEAK